MSLQKTACMMLVSLFSLVALFGCGSSAVKQRKEQRDKMLQSSKMYCEFINGEVYANDVEIALNIEMAKRCDSEKPFSLTQYKTPSESQGILYCCSMSSRGASLAKKDVSVATAKREKEKSEEPKKQEDNKKTPDTSDEEE